MINGANFLTNLCLALFPNIFIDEFNDNLAGLSQVEKDHILSVMKAAQEEHFEPTHAISTQRFSKNSIFFLILK